MTILKHKRAITDTICNGIGMVVRVVGHTNDTKRGWFNTIRITEGEGARD